MENYDALLALLREKGLRVTAQRKIILEILYQNKDRVVSLLTLYDAVKEKSCDVNLSTIYRNIEQLEENHIIHRLTLEDGKDYFSLVCENHHHHHIICTGCGKKVALHYCPYEELVAVSKKQNFQLQGHDILLYGLCEDCIKK